MVGTTAFDQTGATHSADSIATATCGIIDIFQDVWYVFTPPANDIYEFESFNSGFGDTDTRFALYSVTSCPADALNLIDCDDDGGANVFHSKITAPLTAGVDVLLRVGTYLPTSLTFPTDLVINVFVPPDPPVNPWNGNRYQAVAAPDITWDDARIAAAASSFMGVQGHLATITDQNEDDFIHYALGDVDHHWVGGFQDQMDPNFMEPGGGWKWITGEPFIFTNWFVGPDNGGNFPSEDFMEVLDYANVGSNWNDANDMAPTAGFIIEFEVGSGPTNEHCNGDGGNQVGCTNCPCGNESVPGTIGGCLNSVGTSARLAASGSASIHLPPNATNDLRFSISGAPPNAFCILTSGDGVAPGNMANPCFGMSSGVQSVAFDGLRCAIINTRRHGGRSADANGDVGVTNSPWGGEGGPPAGLADAGVVLTFGQTRFWQVINRDDALLNCMRGLNTSQAIEITFFIL